MTKEERALEYFRSGFNCAQSVLTTFGTGHGLSEDKCLKVSCAFGAGMGRRQLTCGAVTGALMTLGLKYGKGLYDHEEKKQDTYIKTNEFIAEFIRLNKTISCLELLDGLDMSLDEDKRRIQELGLFQKNCEKYVTDAIRILERMEIE